MRRVSCLGSGSGNTGDAMYDAMYRVGQLLAAQNIEVATGGYSGAGMEAAARGAFEAGGRTIGFTLKDYEHPANPHFTEVIACADYCTRLARLLLSDGFIVSAGGGAGSFVELAAINLHNQKIWEQGKRTAILSADPANLTEAWDWRMLNRLMAWGVLRAQDCDQIIVVNTPREAVNWVTQAIVPDWYDAM